MKDLFLKMIKSMAEAFFNVCVEAIKKLDWKAVIHKAYVDFKPSLEKKAKESESKVDDAVVKALDVIFDKFFKKEEPKAVEAKNA